VARELRRHDVAFDEVRVPRRQAGRQEVAALTRQRRVPVLVIEGEAICDSRRIVEHLRWRAGEHDR
jgi:glutathione S-transferase